MSSSYSYRLLLVALCLPAIVIAEQAWPMHAAEAQFTQVKTATLPETLRAALLMLDEFTQGKRALPESLSVARVDLNGDHADEFIVQGPHIYGGGPMIFVFERREASFVEVADTQGTIYFGAKANGYFELVSQSHGGGGEYTRTLQRHERGRYHIVRVADYREVEPGGQLQFVRERSPKNGFRQ